MIEGVSIYPLKHIKVPKGDIFHAFKSTDENYKGFGEVYFSLIKPNQVKGWKRHNRYVLNLFVVFGHIKFVIYDDREGSITKGQFQEITLSMEDNYQRLTISPGLWMAFASVDIKNSMLMDIIPDLHDPDESDRKDIDEIPYKFNL